MDILKILNRNKIKKNVMKNKRGITFLVLVITITFMLILASTLSISFFNLVDSTNKKEYANEINSIQKVVDQYEFMNGKYPVVDDVVTFSLSTLSAEEKEQFANEPGYATNEVIFKEIDLYEAGVDEVTRGTKADDYGMDVYVVSETTGKVYYLKGEKYDGVKYYTLTNELKKSLGI